MQFVAFVCVLFVAAVLVNPTDGRKTFSMGRKSGGNSRRSGSTNFKHKQLPPPVKPHKTDSVNTNFLNFERAGSSHSSVNTHFRGDPFKKTPEAPKHNIPKNHGPIGFEKLEKQGNQKIGFDKVNAEVQHKPSNSFVPSAPVYPANNPPYPVGVSLGTPVKSVPSAPGSVPSYPAKPVASAPAYPSGVPYSGDSSYPVKPIASAPYGPPPAYPGYGGNTHASGFEAPPSYPGRPVNAPPVYSPADSGQRSQPSAFSYPSQHNNYPYQQVQNIGQTNIGQHNNFGYPNTGTNFNSYPSQSYGFRPGNTYVNTPIDGNGQSYSGYNGYSYGGSQSNPYGGSPFSSNFVSNPYPGNYNSNPYYSPGNFGFSSNPGYFGSSSSAQQGYPGNYNNYGYHKKSRFGNLPIPIPIPIPIPLGSFGGFGGSNSYNHNLLETFIKGKNISSVENTTTSVFILNNSTVTPCTTDQFIYDSLNVTVVSCTADNCTAVKVFTTTNTSGELSVQSAVITMCLEPNATYSSHAENVSPTVSKVHNYWMRVCKGGDTVNNTGNITDQATGNVTLKINDLTVNETHSNEANSSIDSSLFSVISPANTQNTTTISSSENSTLDQPTSLTNSTSNEYNSTPIALSSSFVSVLNRTAVNSTLANSTGNSNSSVCEIFNCSWIEMCLPSIEIIDHCVGSECNKTKTAYQPCVRIKMCKSPSTPISTFATINTTISRTDQFNNVSAVNDVANLTLISYIFPTLPSNHSQNLTDSSSIPSPVNLFKDVCAPSNATEAAVGDVMSKMINGTLCIASMIPEATNSTNNPVMTTITTSATPKEAGTSEQ